MLLPEEITPRTGRGFPLVVAVCWLACFCQSFPVNLSGEKDRSRRQLVFPLSQSKTKTQIYVCNLLSFSLQFVHVKIISNNNSLQLTVTHNHLYFSSKAPGKCLRTFCFKREMLLTYFMKVSTFQTFLTRLYQPLISVGTIPH